MDTAKLMSLIKVLDCLLLSRSIHNKVFKIVGTHLMCASVTQAFLDYTKALGNDLSTPKPQYRFPGLKPGDNWCLCVYRWYQAKRDGVAPNLVLPATNRASLEYLEQWNININDLSSDAPLDSCNKTSKTDL